jgi:hypothetical protein
MLHACAERYSTREDGSSGLRYSRAGEWGATCATQKGRPASKASATPYASLQSSRPTLAHRPAARQEAPRARSLCVAPLRGRLMPARRPGLAGASPSHPRGGSTSARCAPFRPLGPSRRALRILRPNRSGPLRVCDFPQISRGVSQREPLTKPRDPALKALRLFPLQETAKCAKSLTRRARQRGSGSAPSATASASASA